MKNDARKKAQNTTQQTISEPPEPSIAPIVRALEDIFKALNKKLFESKLSKPVITVAPNPPRSDALGWFTSKRVWKDGQSDGYFEINICAEYLKRPFEELCATLLHEMIHLLNAQQGEKGTCRDGTYHTKVFKKTAEAHGLIVNKSKCYGYNETSLSPEYKSIIETFDQTPFTLYRERVKETAGTTDTNSDPSSAKKSSTRIYKCPKCATTVRATKEVRIKCVDCNSLFKKME